MVALHDGGAGRQAAAGRQRGGQQNMNAMCLLCVLLDESAVAPHCAARVND